MKALCLGAAGKISRESTLDLVEHSDFEKITVGDYNEEAGREVVAWLNDPRVDFRKINIRDKEATVRIMKEYDLVMDGTTISLNDLSTACIAEAGCHGINLNGFGAEYKYDALFKKHQRTCVPGFGMTPGTTNMMAKYAADQMETVDTVRISHGAYRPIAFSASITETTTTEYDPLFTGRTVYENGKFIQVPPFARPLEVALPEPYGTNPQYIIPHSETVTLAEYLANKKVKLIEVRGTWPPKNMALIKALYEWGFMHNPKVNVNGVEINIMDAIGAYLMQSPEGQTTDLYGYALHVEVVGMRDGKKIKHTLWHTHPASDGSVEGWEKLRAYTRCVGIPMGIGAILIAEGKVARHGAIIPEVAFNPTDVFDELAKRGIKIHEKIESAE
ncbi:MAG: saccharopine dehydrogenase NADP-binding domain-containing protein [Desulfobacteraceae bacterium]|nr:saccharopine dehydrogenase NADP-binding domain-containing protein [Desulfobacteraceae bacterium]